jgi:E3 ubiquitin-protein ligase SIAH1
MQIREHFLILFSVDALSNFILLFQCAVGHLICSACRSKLKDNKCLLCERTCWERCHGMERVVDCILVPCPYAKHGCAQQIAYHQKKHHAKACAHARCFCPEAGCGFAGPTAALLDHLTAAAGHYLQFTKFRYYTPFKIRATPGLHVLHSTNDGRLFLLNVTHSPLQGVCFNERDVLVHDIM